MSRLLRLLFVPLALAVLGIGFAGCGGGGSEATLTTSAGKKIDTTITLGAPGGILCADSDGTYDVSLTATLTPATATGGKVFFEQLNPVTNTWSMVAQVNPYTGGVAAATVFNVGLGNTTFRAHYIPSNGSLYGESMSTAGSVTVKYCTTTSLSAPVDGDEYCADSDGTYDATLTATVSSVVPVASGSVNFEEFDGTNWNVLGTVSPYTGGAVSFTYFNAVLGNHQVRAEYIPATGSNFAGSTSSSASFLVKNCCTPDDFISASVNGTALTVSSDPLNPPVPVSIPGTRYTGGPNDPPQPLTVQIAVTFHGTPGASFTLTGECHIPQGDQHINETHVFDACGEYTYTGSCSGNKPKGQDALVNGLTLSDGTTTWYIGNAKASF